MKSLWGKYFRSSAWPRPALPGTSQTLLHRRNPRRGLPPSSEICVTVGTLGTVMMWSVWAVTGGILLAIITSPSHYLTGGEEQEIPDKYHRNTVTSKVKAPIGHNRPVNGQVNGLVNVLLCSMGQSVCVHCWVCGELSLASSDWESQVC